MSKKTVEVDFLDLIKDTVVKRTVIVSEITDEQLKKLLTYLQSLKVRIVLQL